MPNLRKAKSKMLPTRCLIKGTLLCLSDDSYITTFIYKKCDVDHIIVIFLNQNRYIQNH
jgi:hypothetical protein